ncbi:MAG: peptide chain release factor N(5)-glutamine methyltransferase [Victivallales bacterium]|nr:peptide chain release factor N(5)-glutamine methyltransferase [Victivallales bacterium]
MTSAEQALLTEGADQLRRNGIDNGLNESRWILEQTRADSKAPHVVRQFRNRIARRADGEPLQYVLGTADFHDITLEVGPGVLIPRPETEQLVELALELWHGDSALDLCTGSGAIALALAHARPTASITATDLSPEALEYARRNRARLALDNVALLEGDLYAPLPHVQRYDLITANPPYVTAEEYANLEPVVRDYEPRLALVAEEHGLAVLRRIADQAPSRLLPGAWLLCEIGDTQGKAAAELLRHAGLRRVTVRQDYAGHDRFVQGQAPAEEQAPAEGHAPTEYPPSPSALPLRSPPPC